MKNQLVDTWLTKLSFFSITILNSVQGLQITIKLKPFSVKMVYKSASGGGILGVGGEVLQWAIS